MKLAINGAAGRMGMLVGKLAPEFDFEIVAAREHSENPNIGKDYGELITGKSNDIIISDKIPETPDVLIDFSLPQSLQRIIAECLELKCAFLTGTTGFSDEHLKIIEEASKNIPVLYSANFSIGIATIKSLVEQAAKILYSSGFDIEIFEAHHNKKVDSPSGTALILGKSAAEGAGLDFEKAARFSREGKVGERKKEEIGFSILRGGTIVGEHSIIFAGEQEIVEISHKALNREIFARGALKAAAWLTSQPPAFYSLDDFLKNF